MLVGESRRLGLPLQCSAGIWSRAERSSAVIPDSGICCSECEAVGICKNRRKKNSGKCLERPGITLEMLPGK